MLTYLYNLIFKYMDDNIKFKNPTETKEVVVEEKKSASSRKVNPLLIVLGVLLLFTLIPVLGLLFFRFNLSGNYQKCNINKQVVCDTQGSDQKDMDTSKVDCMCAAPEAKNKGWALITAPDINVSMEIPNDELVSNQFRGTTLESKWTFSYTKTLEFDPKVLGTFKASLEARFFPISVQDIACGGNGCVNASYITVDGYYLGDNRTLEYVSEQYQKLQTGEENTLVGKMSTRWNLPVYEYRLVTPGGGSEGYIVVKDGYCYNISYYINAEPTGTVTTANKILDSIKFN